MNMNVYELCLLFVGFSINSIENVIILSKHVQIFKGNCETAMYSDYSCKYIQNFKVENKTIIINIDWREA